MPDPRSSPSDPSNVFFSVEGDSGSLEDKIDNQEYRNRLSDLLSDETRDSSEKLREILKLGAEWLGVENGHLVRIDPADGTHTITEVSGPHPAIEKGDISNLSSTYCRKVIANDAALAVENAPEQGWNGDPAYETYELSTYFGAKVVVSEKLYGTVCFVGEEPRVEPFSESDAAALALLVRTVGQELERRRHEDRLQQTTARLKALFEESPDMITIHDTEGTLIVPNPRLCERTGYEAEELVRMKVWDLDRGLDPEAAKAFWAEMEPGDRHRWETEYACKDGSTFPVEVELRCLDLEDRNQFVTTGRDITERKQAERELRETKQRLEKTLESLTEAVIVVDSAARQIVTCNAAVEQVFGYEKKELIGKSTEVLHVDRQAYERFGEISEPALDEKGYFTGEYKMRRKDGQIIHTEHTVTPLHGTDWRESVVSIIRDVTERKRKEQELRERGRQLEQIRKTVTDVVWISDADKSKIEFITESYEEIWGRPTEEVEERIRSFVEAIHPDDRERVRGALETQAETPEAYAETYRVVQPDGEIRWVRDRAAGVYDESGTLERIIGVATDVTERKQREQELQVFKQVLDQANDAVLITEAHPLDEPGPKITYANPAFEEMTGYDAEELKGETPRILQGPETDRAVLDSLRDALEEGTSWSGETINYRKDGTSYPVQWSIAPVRSEEGDIECWVSVQRDITDHRTREQELRAAKEKAERLNRMKSAFLANMSHEIRTPLTSILGFAEAMGEEIENLAIHVEEAASSPLTRFAELIQKSGHRLLETLDAVLNLSRLEAEEMELTMEPTNLNEEVREAADLFGPKAEEAGLDLRVDTPAEPVWARADEGGLRIVLQNLLSNALKYTDEDGRVWLRTRAEENTAVVEVEDTGIGMAPDVVPELFEPFRQESEGKERDYEGTGLGLAVTKEAVEQMGGSINVDTAKGEGSCFTVRLPRTDG